MQISNPPIKQISKSSSMENMISRALTWFELAELNKKDIHFLSKVNKFQSPPHSQQTS